VGHFQAKRTNDILFFKAFIVHTKKICLKKGVDILRIYNENLKEIEEIIEKADLLLDEINRRAIKGETIPHEEKIFSIFEAHTEWIKKWKAGVLVEWCKSEYS
jgi:hypothetical protein